MSLCISILFVVNMFCKYLIEMFRKHVLFKIIHKQSGLKDQCLLDDCICIFEGPEIRLTKKNIY